MKMKGVEKWLGVPALIRTVAVSMLLTSCDMFEYHPYDNKLHGNVGVHAGNIRLIEKNCSGKEQVRFAFVTDSQGSCSDLADAIKVIKDMGDIDFIVHGGDQSDFGLPKEFGWCRDLLESSGLPYVAVIGNHDCLGNGKKTFEYVYGVPDFSFNAAMVHFVCLNTVALEYPGSDNVPDFGFIENDVKRVAQLNENCDSITHTVVVMHSRPGDEQFNNGVASVFGSALRKYPGGDSHVADGKLPRAFCVNGHNHRLEIKNIFGDGMIYYGCPNVSGRVIFVFTLDKNGYVYEKIDF